MRPVSKGRSDRMEAASRTNGYWGQKIVSCIGAVALMAALSVSAAQVGRAAGGPTPGGSITLRQGQHADCLDPQRTALGDSDLVFESVVDGLVSVDDNFKIQPNLASSWDISADGKKVTFH